MKTQKFFQIEFVFDSKKMPTTEQSVKFGRNVLSAWLVDFFFLDCSPNNEKKVKELMAETHPNLTKIFIEEQPHELTGNPKWWLDRFFLKGLK